MSTATASLPRRGHALFAEVAHFCSAMCAAPKADATLSSGARLWNLYLKTAGMDSVNPALLADRIVQD